MWRNIVESGAVWRKKKILLSITWRPFAPYGAVEILGATWRQVAQCGANLLTTIRHIKPQNMWLNLCFKTIFYFNSYVKYCLKVKIHLLF